MKFIYNGHAKTGGIYQIRNFINGRIYIGSSNRFKSRAYQHKSELEKGIHKNKFMQNDFNKCGTEAFVFEVLEVITEKENRKNVEQTYIDKFFDNCNNCYNIVKTVYPDPTFFSKTPEETIAKRILSNTGKKRSTETCQRISESLKGRFHSEETKKKISLAGSGRSVSQETREKLSEIGKQRIVSQETKQKISKSNSKSKNAYILLDPFGNEIFVENIKVFCKEKGFPTNCMYKMLSGKYPKKHIHCHGYSLITTIPKPPTVKK